MFYDEYGNFGGGGSRVGNAPSRRPRPGRTRTPYNYPSRKYVRPPGAPRPRPRPYGMPPPPRGAPGGRAGFRGGFGWAFGAAALANADPAASRKWARTANDYLAQFLPWDTGELFEPAFTGWGYGKTRPLTDDYPWDPGPEWTKLCDIVPPGGENQRKVGIIPPLTITTTCNVSGVARANFPVGIIVPANATYMGMVASGAAWPNVNGRPYWTWGRPASPNNRPVLWKVGRIVLPLNDPFAFTETKMERVGPAPDPFVAEAGAGYGYVPPYGVPASSVVFEPGKPPVTKPRDIHLRVPPERREKEDKPVDDSGRSVKQVYGAITEVGDAMDCMQKSFKKNPDPSHHKHVPIPQRFDLKVRRMISEAAAGNIDWQQFVNCMAINNAQDAAVGGLNRAASRRLQNNPYSPRRTSPIGWGTGGFSTRMR